MIRFGQSSIFRKATPKTFSLQMSTKIDSLNDIQNGADEILRFLNGESINVEGNLLTIVFMPGVIQRPTDVSETVKKIFDNKFGILQIKKQINTRYKINVDIDFASVAFITDIQSDFFRTRIQQKKQNTQ